MADFNRRGIPATDGKLWHGRVLWKLLQRRALLDVGIVNAEEWNNLQAALKVRAANRTVRTAKASPLLDLTFCARCGGKMYRWRETKRGLYYGRCRNEVHRYDTDTPCTLPRIPYELLQQAVEATVAGHAGEAIEERVTDHARKLRLDDIAKELMALLPCADLAA